MVTDDEILKQLEQGADTGVGLDQGISAQAYSNIQGQENNLIVWQLELDNILERIEHLLRGDVIKDDGQGGYSYVPPEDKDLIILNDFGVGLIMNFLSFYLNRNTILSNHKEERIFEILHDLGIEFSDLVYINYEKMGLDTVEKRSRYPSLSMNLFHMIESAYMRSLHGEERDSLRKARIVTQTQPLAAPQGSPYPQGGNSLNPIKRIFGG